MRAPVDNSIAAVHADVRQYYTAKVTRYGATPLGVDWSCVPTQQLRFLQLMKLCSTSERFSLDDLGCGYGALLAYLDEREPHREVDYLGIDLAEAMIRRARRLWRGRNGIRFVVGHASPRVADYCVASGMFNVKLEQPVELWERFIAETLTDIAGRVRLGFAVNFKSPLPPARPGPPQLYRCRPERWVEYCEQLGLQVEMRSDYGMREHTLLIRK